MFRQVLARLEADGPSDNSYNAVKVHFWLAKVLFAQKKFDACVAECERIGKFVLTDEVEKRLDDELAEAEEMLEVIGRPQGSAKPRGKGKATRSR